MEYIAKIKNIKDEKLILLANNMAYSEQEAGYLNNYDIIIKFDYTIN